MRRKLTLIRDLEKMGIILAITTAASVVAMVMSVE
jgi:hypothetical protein